MKSIRQIRLILITIFVVEVFIAQLVAWGLINHIGSFGKTFGCITGTAFVFTVVTCSSYILLRVLYDRFKGTANEGGLAEEICEMISILHAPENIWHEEENI